MKILKKFNNYIKEDLESVMEYPEQVVSSRNASSDSQIVDATEEDDEYIGSKMLKSLAEALGTEVSDNSVSYEGKKINFYSETEKFHVDKKKFKTVDEVVSYLKNEKDTSIQKNIEEPMNNDQSPMRKHLESFKDFTSNNMSDDAYAVADEYENNPGDNDSEFYSEFGDFETSIQNDLEDPELDNELGMDNDIDDNDLIDSGQENDWSGDEMEIEADGCSSCNCDPCICDGLETDGEEPFSSEEEPMRERHHITRSFRNFNQR